MCANKLTVDKFFHLYEKIVKDYHIESPMNIWNCNESGVQDIPKEQEVLGVTGQRPVMLPVKNKVKLAPFSHLQMHVDKCLPHW